MKNFLIHVAKSYTREIIARDAAKRGILILILLTIGCSSPTDHLEYKGERKLIFATKWISPMYVRYDFEAYNNGDIRVQPLDKEWIDGKLDEEELNKLRSLLIALESQSPKATYSPTKPPKVRKEGDPMPVEGQPIAEVSIEFLTTDGMKQTKIKENDWKIDLNLKRQYPAALIELLQFAEVNSPKPFLR